MLLTGPCSRKSVVDEPLEPAEDDLPPPPPLDEEDAVERLLDLSKLAVNEGGRVGCCCNSPAAAAVE